MELLLSIYKSCFNMMTVITHGMGIREVKAPDDSSLHSKVSKFLFNPVPFPSPINADSTFYHNIISFRNLT